MPIVVDIYQHTIVPKCSLGHVPSQKYRMDEREANGRGADRLASAAQVQTLRARRHLYVGTYF